MSGINLAEIYDALNEYAPFQLALPNDPVGVIVGAPHKKVKKVLVCLSLTPPLIAEAIKNRVHLIISHHPIITHPIRKFCEDNPEANKVIQLIKNDIASIVCHTNFDISHNGLNYTLAQKLNLKNIKGLIPLDHLELYKLVTFVPKEYLEKVRNAVCSNGAGIIGEYAYCSFSTSGVGTFLPSEKAKPFLGKIGAVNEENEERFEVLVPGECLSKVLDALLDAHPYEEVAYDIYPLKNRNNRVSIGVVGEIESQTTLEELSFQVKKVLGIPHLRIVGEKDKTVTIIGIISGSGGGEINNIHMKLDVLITGDIKYHQALLALEKSISLIDAGHFGTEYIFTTEVAEFLKQKFPLLEVITLNEKDPFTFI